MKSSRFFATVVLLILSMPAFAIHRGLDSLEFTAYAPLADKPVKVFTYVPTWGKIADMPVLITMHGAERSGMNGIICWREFAEQDGFIVISPQFSKTWYKENDYQFGGVVDPSTGEVRPEEMWTYSIIEPIFEHVKSLLGNKAEEYDMQGHSAGGQFVHRYLIAKPNARVRRAVACNPGSWTWCNPDGTVNGSDKAYKWPYSINGTPFNDMAHLASFFSREMYICLGNKDTDPGGSAVPRNEEAIWQGAHRFMRGQSFYSSHRRLASKLGLEFNWKLSIVDGIGHQGRGMVYGMRSGGRYTASAFTKTAAYYLIYGKK